MNNLSKKSEKRLNILADFMDKLPAKARRHFDMGVWFQHDGRKKTNPKDLFDCGTKACALGWATMVPQFRKLGLKIVMDDDTDGRIVFGNSAWPAKSFFGIDGQQEDELFINARVATPKQWAKYCRECIARWKEG